ncbi:MAG TPA: hypothetical protein VMV92_45585 [Streptosporangiaceae bacterium]|nr:hypothetical protein [Streptosporangiaceae bacterium]
MDATPDEATAAVIEAAFGGRWGIWLSSAGRWWAARRHLLTAADLNAGCVAFLQAADPGELIHAIHHQEELRASAQRQAAPVIGAVPQPQDDEEPGSGFDPAVPHPARVYNCWLGGNLYSRKVIGWAAVAHMRTSLVTAALDMAISARKPRLRQSRRQRGLSQAELVGQAGVSLATVARLGLPNAPCRCRTLGRLATALGEQPAALAPASHATE